MYIKNTIPNDILTEKIGRGKKKKMSQHYVTYIIVYIIYYRYDNIMAKTTRRKKSWKKKTLPNLIRENTGFIIVIYYDIIHI